MKNLFVPLWIYLRIVDKLKISPEKLQQNVIAYKTGNGTNFVQNPIFPISISPVFHMIFAHNLADGIVINPKRGRLPYFGYRQFDELYRLSYVSKAEFVFGKICYAKNYVKRTTIVYLPAALSSLFFKFYKLDVRGFLSEKTRIPLVIFEDGKDSMLAVLIAFIIDEGHIDSTQISIGLKNIALVRDLQKICVLLGYNSTISYGKGDYKLYARLYISRNGMKKFYNDYLLLNRKYSVIDLGWKGYKIKKSFDIYNRKISMVKGNQEIILSSLRNENLTINQLANRINITRQGVRYHMNNLLKQGKVRLIDNKQLNWIYGV